MAIGIAPARPPFVEFKQVAREDRNASVEAGRRVTKNINMAFVMQPGSRDCLEIVAEDWLSQIRKKSAVRAPDAYPESWVEQFDQKFDLWKKGIEAPVNGTAIGEAPFLSPAEVENLKALKIFTIEDLAAATEEALGRFGMGARSIRDKARNYIQAKSAAEVELETMREQINELKAQLASLSGDQTDMPKRRGRPPKED